MHIEYNVNRYDGSLSHHTMLTVNECALTYVSVYELTHVHTRHAFKADPD